jgi:hypothetical protein
MNSINQSEIEQEILASACEDYTGLYEIIWALNTSHPKIGETEKIVAAAAAVQSLLERGLIELFSSEWETQTHKPIFDKGFKRIANDSTTWRPEKMYFSFAATDAGERFYLGRHEAI